MHSFRSCAPWFLLLIPAALLAQDITTEGTLSVAAGGTLLDGDRPAFQRILQQKKDGFGGIEEFRLIREDKDSVFKFNARALVGEGEYKLGARFEKTDRFYFDAGYERFRVYYDGSSALVAPTGTSFVMFDEDLSLIRSKLWAEIGAFTANKTLIKLRLQRNERDGTKDSTHWGDTNLAGNLGTRSITPAFYDLDEVTTTITFDVGNESQENVKWNVGARYSETELDNKKVTRRRPYEPTADRITVTKDTTENDIFAVHGYYARKVNEKLTVSAGALRTNLDTAIRGSRIFGQTFDPVFDPVAVRRQYHDEGYPSLHGDAELKQTVLNLNAVYLPQKNWSIRPSIRFENLHQESMSEFVETNVGNVPLSVTAIEELEGEHTKKWDEFAEAIEARYTGKPNWTFSVKAEWIQGQGDLNEAIIEHGEELIHRDVDNERFSQKYSLSANWYVKPGLTFAAQYYLKNNQNDFNSRVDSTDNTGSDRYPSFLANQDFEVNDFNVRMTWKPVSAVNLVTRYDNQQSKILTGGEGLAIVQSSKITSHIISQNATWSPSGRLFLMANVNVTYDQMETPFRFATVQNSDNNYVNGTLGGGYAAGKQDDLYVDYSWYRSRNFLDNWAVSVPYLASQKFQSASLTWVRRQSENLVYTMKYAYVTNRDQTYNLNDFDAHVLYAKVQYKF
ncbi:MAG: hypothetical protein Q7S40_26435 [Opitutaceae bacterium]|nr:hypothetical protein [Opitutaceae bacterium]